MKTFPLVYITIPDKLQKKVIGQVNFVFDSAIPLPIELPPVYSSESPGGESSSPEKQIEQITPEMILSGLLQALAESPDGNNSAYYRSLIFALKPAIASELQDAAIIKAKNRDYETALEIFKLLFGLKGQDPHLLLNRALVLEERVASATSVVSAAEVSDTSPAVLAAELAYEDALAFPVPDTLFYAAFFYEKRGDYARAASCLESFLDTIHEEELTDFENNKQIKARELLAEIRNNGLDNSDFIEAVVLIRKGDEEKGINKAKGFLERHPRAGKGWFVLGWGLRCLSRWDNAIECFRKALTLGCVNADTYNELAICLLETGDLATAEKELEKALHIDPDNVKIISNMGILAMKQGNNEKAEAFFRTALELDPEDPIALAFLG